MAVEGVPILEPFLGRATNAESRVTGKPTALVLETARSAKATSKKAGVPWSFPGVLLKREVAS